GAGQALRLRRRREGLWGRRVARRGARAEALVLLRIILQHIDWTVNAMVRTRVVAAALTVFAAGFLAGQAFDGGNAEAQGRKVFELRTYTSPEGRLDDLLARF